MNHDRFRFRIWCKEINEYLVGTFLVGGEMIHNAVDFESFLDVGNFVIEQCTGLKDKNGNLIYEGDLLTDGTDIGTVIWTGTGWGCTDFLFKKKPETLQICGNIHETKGKENG